jgi:hypothetical protein
VQYNKVLLDTRLNNRVVDLRVCFNQSSLQFKVTIAGLDTN